MRHRSFALLVAVAALPAGLVAQHAAAPPTAGSAPAALPLKFAARPTSAEISATDLMSRLYVFADDSMQGREAGTVGALKGTTYIANQLKKLGLTPAGDSGTYFQNVPFIARRLSRNTQFSVNGILMSALADFAPLPFRGAVARKLNGVQAVYGGVYGDSVNAITAAQAAGKLVVLSAPNGLGRIAPTSPLQQAAGIVVIGDESISPLILMQARQPMYTLKPEPSAPAVPVTIVVTKLTASQMLGGKPDTMKVGAIGNNIVGNLIYDEVPAPTRNVVAILPGSDPTLRGQYVAIGAHSDHIGVRPIGAFDHDSLHAFNTQRFFATDNPTGASLTDEQRATRDAAMAAIRINMDSAHRLRPARRDSINNGADDDGSGTVTVLEVAEAFAKGKVKPKRSLLFVWHTGEEKGLLGSRYFTDNPTVPRDSIVAQINMDQVGRGAATDLAAGSERFLMLVGSRRLSTELGDLTEAVNKADKKPFTLDYTYDANGHPENVYCRSDHYNYARYGIPVVFVTTGLHGDYHQVTDEPQYIDYPHMAHIGQFVFTLANRIAGLDHRPLVDKPKPDPAGACKQ
ncbi:MAG: M28 family peptidase [bacterium]